MSFFTILPPASGPTPAAFGGGSSNATAATNVGTASGYLALLREDDPDLRAYALNSLLELVDTQWHEVAEVLPLLEEWSEGGGTTAGGGGDSGAPLPLPLRQTAAAVASRVFFHLEEPTQALRLALQAGPQHFDVMKQTPYEERLVAAALDAYVRARTGTADDDDDDKGAAGSALPVDRLREMVYRILENCCACEQWDLALSIALEAREPDRLQRVLELSQKSASGSDWLKYALEAAGTVVADKAFRQQVWQVLADCLQNASPAEEYHLVLVYQLLNRHDQVAEVLRGLLSSDDQDKQLLGLQICFDLMDSGDQAFAKKVARVLFPPTENDEGAAAADADAPAAPALASSAGTTNATPLEQAKRVLVEGFPSELALSFLHKHSKADKFVVEQLKRSLEERSSGSRSSLLHHAAIVTHSYLYAGTTNDSFLRDHLDWMKKASNWAKFSATASLGVVHARHTSEAMHLLEPYLPPDPSSEDAANAAAIAAAAGGGGPPSTGFAEGGSLYALGLIHAQPGTSFVKQQEALRFLRSHLRGSHNNPVLAHGAALGTGLVAMGTADLGIVQELKEVLDTDSAIAGEAAGIALGMVLVGTGATNVKNSLPSQTKEDIMEIVTELKNYARETQHEKIIRGIAMGLALMNYGQEENADAAIEEMRGDRDPVMRYGAQYALALAYCGTGSNKAIRILLHTAVSDVSDDVRMAAVIGLAFVLYKTPDRVPQLVKLLLESFNPHVRYSSCMAVGIVMAGTGDPESIAMLEPMLDDMTDYVRQGALMGTAMIYMQQSDTCNGRKIRSFREKISTIVTEKHQSTLTKMGAILASGILDAGGRNCSLVLGSRNGFTRMSSAVGLVLWLQHWHWYPMMHMFSLALTPTCTIGLNKDFKYPKNFEIQCNSKPSAFAYPKKLEEKKKEEKKRVETVTLSTTAKEKARLARKRAKKGEKDSAMDVDKDEKEEAKKEDNTKEEGKEGEKDKDKDKDDSMDVDKAEETPEVKPKKKREPEPTSFRVSNPARITTAQSLVCEFDLQQRYRPIRPEEKPIGVIILTDSKPGEEEDLGTVKSPSEEPEGELPPPESFEWTPPNPPPVPSVESSTDTTSSPKD